MLPVLSQPFSEVCGPTSSASASEGAVGSYVFPKLDLGEVLAAGEELKANSCVQLPLSVAHRGYLLGDFDERKQLHNPLKVDGSGLAYREGIMKAKMDHKSPYMESIAALLEGLLGHDWCVSADPASEIREVKGVNGERLASRWHQDAFSLTVSATLRGEKAVEYVVPESGKYSQFYNHGGMFYAEGEGFSSESILCADPNKFIVHFSDPTKMTVCATRDHGRIIDDGKPGLIHRSPKLEPNEDRTIMVLYFVATKKPQPTDPALQGDMNMGRALLP